MEMGRAIFAANQEQAKVVGLAVILMAAFLLLPLIRNIRMAFGVGASLSLRMNARRPKRTEEPRISPRRAAAEARVGGHKYALAAYRAGLADYLYAGSVRVADTPLRRAGEAPAKLE